ncbi:MAG: class I SAM-dependent methyltransferase [Gammaproteobacteria bacterium]
MNSDADLWSKYNDKLEYRPTSLPESFLVRYLCSSRPVRFGHQYHFEGKTILDAACGNGRNFNLLTCLGFRIAGFDLSKKQIVNLRKFWPDILLEVGDFLSIPFEEQKFDWVLCINSVYYVTNEKLFFEAMKNLSSKLKQHGRLFVSFMGERHFALDTVEEYGENFDVIRVMSEYSQLKDECLSVMVPKWGKNSINNLGIMIGKTVNFIGEYSDELNGLERHFYYAELA